MFTTTVPSCPVIRFVPTIIVFSTGVVAPTKDRSGVCPTIRAGLDSGTRPALFTAGASGIAEEPSGDCPRIGPVFESDGLFVALSRGLAIGHAQVVSAGCERFRRDNILRFCRRRKTLTIGIFAEFVLAELSCKA